MKKGIIKGSSFILMAVFMFACAASDPNVETAKLALQNGDLQKALEATDQAISTNQGVSPEGYYYKAQVLEDLAKQNAVKERVDYYNRMRTALDSSAAQYQRVEQGSGKELLVDNFRLEALRSEYAPGVQIYQKSDSVETPRLLTGAHHFINASTIYPDSANYYYLAADMFYLGDEVEKSKEWLENGIEVDQNPNAFPFRRLATLYSIDGNQEKSIAILEEGIERVEEDIELIQLLADAYISAGESQKALQILEDLIARDPENPNYHLVYGSQLYNSVVDQVQELEGVYESIDEIEDGDASDENLEELTEREAALEDRIAKLTDRAISELEKANELDPDNINTYLILGQVYTNKAAILVIQSNFTEDIDTANELRDRAAEIYKQALEPLEAGVEMAPDNQRLWNQLFQVYTRLGMTDKASEAMDKAGI